MIIDATKIDAVINLDVRWILGQQVDEANDATAKETNEAIGASVSVEAVDSDNEDEVLDNQLTELEKLDVAKGRDE